MKKNSKKILTILGARPQFIKASSLSQEIEKYANFQEIIINTGQHSDANMSDFFINELSIKSPKYNLGISNLSHGAMLGKMIEEIEKILSIENPNFVLVYGDTNSTLAGALAACKLGIKIVHIEAGLRSFNQMMPEEYNRVITDRISSILFCPTKNSVINLKKEGFPHIIYNQNQSIINVGDIMHDTFIKYNDLSLKKISLNRWNLEEKKYIYCTIHRPVNVDNKKNLNSIINAILKINEKIKIVISVHPRTKKKLKEFNMNTKLNNLVVLNPQPYLDNLRLIIGSKLIMTDSGGMQKEAYFSKVPCVTLREETEWIETLENGNNILSGSNYTKIVNSVKKILNHGEYKFISPYGNGDTSKKIVQFLESCL